MLHAELILLSFRRLARCLADTDSLVVIATIERLALLSTVLLASCRDAASTVFPPTPLGRMGRDWLAAHNRAEGHAIVHFTMVNRGTAPMNGAQTDSAVYAGVKLAQELGRLVPIKLLHASDTSMAVLLRSANRGMWTVEFKSAAQPSLVKVLVRMDPSN